MDQRIDTFNSIIISAYSKYFERACSSPFLEASQQRIELSEDLPEAVKCMIEYFYKLDYDASEGLPELGDQMTDDSPPYIEEPQFEMQRHAYIYAVAEKYEVPGLKTVALEKFKEQAARHGDWCVVRLLWAARTIYLDILLPDDDKELRRILVDAFIYYASANTGALQVIEWYFQAIPQFATDLAIKLMGGFTRDRMWTKCPRCNRRQETQQHRPSPRNCSACRGGSVPAEDEAVLLSNVTIKKFW